MKRSRGGKTDTCVQVSSQILPAKRKVSAPADYVSRAGRLARCYRALQELPKCRSSCRASYAFAFCCSNPSGRLGRDGSFPANAVGRESRSHSMIRIIRFELKYDGFRALAVVEYGAVHSSPATVIRSHRSEISPQESATLSCRAV